MEDLFQKGSSGGPTLDRMNVGQVLDGMARHPRHNAIQFEAMQRLHQLTGNAYQASQVVQHPHGLATILNSLQAFPNDHRLCLFGACVLGNCFLHTGDSGADKVDDGAVSSFIQLFERLLELHDSHAGVQCYCLYATSGLCVQSSLARTQVLQSRLLRDQMPSVMRSLPDDSFLQTTACQVLWNLADGGSSALPDDLGSVFVPLIRTALSSKTSQGQPDLLAIANAVLEDVFHVQTNNGSLVRSNDQQLNDDVHVQTTTSLGPGGSNDHLLPTNGYTPKAALAAVPVRLERDKPAVSESENLCPSQKMTLANAMDW